MAPFPLFGELDGPPYTLDFSAANPRALQYNTKDYEQFQQQIFDEIKAAGASWAVGLYKEDRAGLLRHFPQMIAEARVYHAGLDIVVPAHRPLHAPIDASVHAVGFDAGLGNYGGFVVLVHKQYAAPYSFYGHLERPHCVRPGQQLSAGDVFARTGSHADSGHWFSHTHVQLLTQRALSEARMTQGYVDADDLAQIDELFPDPADLFASDFAQS